MSILTAFQNGDNVLVYNEKNNLMFSKAGKLVGFTGSSLSVQTNGNCVVTYNTNGNPVSFHNCK